MGVYRLNIHVPLQGQETGLSGPKEELILVQPSSPPAVPVSSLLNL